MRNKCVANHVMKRDGKYYYVRHIPKDLTHHYTVRRLCFSLKTNSDSIAIRFSKSITQRIKETNTASPYAFPRYTSSKGTNGNSVSAAINKWLKPRYQRDELYPPLDTH